MARRWRVSAMLSILVLAAFVLTTGTVGCSSKSKKSTPAQLVILTESLGNAAVSESYSAWLQASGGTLPYSWILDSGSLPNGLALNTNGLIAGTPSQAGTFTFTVRVRDDANGTATGQLSLLVIGPLAVVTDSLPVASLGVQYDESLQAQGGSQPYDWVVSAGALPDGLDMSAQGLISGIPLAEGVFDFTVQVEDSEGETASRALSIEVLAELTIITASPLPDGVLLENYSVTLDAAGGTPSYEWSGLSGALPVGLALSLDGTISGAPEETGSFDITVQVLDSVAAQATKSFSVTIYEMPPQEWSDTFDDETKIANMEYVTVESGMAGLERGSAGSTEQLDQFQEDGGGGITSTYFGQTFTAGMTGELTKISVKCGQGANGPTNITLQLSGSGVSASATTYVTDLGWYDFTFDPKPSVVAGNVYQFMLYPESGSIEVAWNANNTGYPGGNILTREGLTLSGDLHFRTYVVKEGDFVSDTGTVMSVEIAPTTVVKWIEFSFADGEPAAANTDVRYTVEAWNDGSSAWETPSLTDAGGNSNGDLDDSPVDLSDLDAAVYTKLRLTAVLKTEDTANPEGPEIDEWKVTYQP